MATKEQIAERLREKFENDLPGLLEMAGEEAARRGWRGVEMEGVEEKLRDKFENALPDLTEDVLAGRRWPEANHRSQRIGEGKNT